jgi:hypothetical protein
MSPARWNLAYSEIGVFQVRRFINDGFWRIEPLDILASALSHDSIISLSKALFPL